MQHVIALPPQPSAGFAEYRLDPARRVAGDPLQRLWIEHQDPSGRFMTGTWWSEPGEWTVRYTETEYCRLLEGRIELIDEAGGVATFKAGDEFVVAAGFTGRWRVVHTALKRFALYEPAAAA
ncbi:cupin domain-containing protein [Aquincola tertiaricarbonis]|uniref:Cupin domain-containing protein n=1 Tax=Aquincola tertiaricarbonis TaxID=391953 RepID=A0ABY4S7U8_AQUTE|nr:cupin domain-containing protein [Aquincola tertiaricarbonis]URI07319.1 cupin domain-containing protein [Aquincola tertiaricarbonis]